MTEEQRKVIDHFNAAVEDCATFCCYTRDKALQSAACARLDEVRLLVETTKSEAIERADEIFANDLLGCSCLAAAMVAELKMWMLLKEQEPDAAWDRLVGAQNNLANAMRASTGFSHLESQAARLHSIEKVVFPPQNVFSTGMLVKEEICSICGKEYEDCSHIKGRPYMGQLCVVRLIPLAVDHIAIVDQPASKHCRAYTIKKEGVVRNIMTWLAEPNDDASGETPNELKLHGVIGSTSTFEDSSL